jgi:CRP-like cAMP-binding protein
MLRHLAQKIQRDRVPRPAQHQQHLAPHLHLPGADAEEPDGTVVENLPTHQDIANMINTSRETVTRALLTWSSKASCRKSRTASSSRSRTRCKSWFRASDRV